MEAIVEKMKADRIEINHAYGTYFHLPKMAGGYEWGRKHGSKYIPFYISFEEKPSWLKRTMVKWILGFEWVDKK